MDLSPRQIKMFDSAFHSDPQVVEKNLNEIFAMLESQQELDAFAIAWDGAPGYLRKMVIREVAAMVPDALPGVTPDTKANQINARQRQLLTRVLVRVSDAGTITAARMLVIRDFAESYQDAQQGVA